MSDYEQDPKIKATPQADFKERYPQPIACFDAWYAARLREAATATTQAEIAAAIGMVQPYADARWCFPERLTKIDAIGRKRRAELAKRGADRMTGEHDRETGEVG